MKKNLLFMSLAIFSLVSCTPTKNTIKVDTATIRIFKGDDLTSPKGRYKKKKNVSFEPKIIQPRQKLSEKNLNSKKGNYI